MRKGRKEDKKIPISTKRIKFAIKQRKTSITKLAQSIGLSRERLSNQINSGEINPLYKDELCKQLDISPEYLDPYINTTISPEVAENMKRHGEYPVIDPEGCLMESYRNYALRVMFKDNISVTKEFIISKLLYRGYTFSDGVPVSETYIEKYITDLDWYLSDQLDIYFSSVPSNYDPYKNRERYTQVDYSDLKQLIIDKYGSVRDFCKQCGFDHASLMERLNNIGDFRQSTVWKLVDALGIDDFEISRYFFKIKD